MRIQLVKNDLQYAEQIYHASQEEHVRTALMLPEGTIDNTRTFIESTILAETEGKVLSRVILNEVGEVIGHTTLKDINHPDGFAHLGTWISYPFWGKGYNEESKQLILEIAFHEVGLEWVFLGASKRNIRSQKAQEKLPYIRLHIENQFPQELEKIEKQLGELCVLHGVHKLDYFHWEHKQKSHLTISIPKNHTAISSFTASNCRRSHSR
ncbi:Protein N-acetyltransferase, RimJ/RimL family [Thermoactinomyces sp. DSM 45891]|uniref:GNAT family N-acetyltransferase n=1 Tax=Thermoactinomyces sp. DSM 45891 TaxID=1761907 RepID=UPI00091B9E2C|nr:GNAT family N-acetyltransferase [Thermoactinomyces sp. DSM 45891]SFX55772.1 Protein N-acetyltransferase, RimJ/RimL family [Thermoactinomyces sp. DSM 45891]